jgi:hypothetical protein
MLLIYNKEEHFKDRTTEEAKQAMPRHWALQDDARRRGIFLAADPLHAPDTAKTVRLRGGKTVTTDGPFAETKEQLAGYYMLDCTDEAEALEWAAKIRSVGCGGESSVEVRQIFEVSRDSQEATAEREYSLAADKRG